MALEKDELAVVKKASVIWGLGSSVIGTLIMVLSAWFVVKGDIASIKQTISHHVVIDGMQQAAIDKHIEKSETFMDETSQAITDINITLAEMKIQNEIILGSRIITD